MASVCLLNTVNYGIRDENPMMRLLTLSLTFTLSLAAFLLLALSVGAAPGTRYVAPHANCAGATPCYATLQAAIDAAQAGDKSIWRRIGAESQPGKVCYDKAITS